MCDSISGISEKRNMLLFYQFLINISVKLPFTLLILTLLFPVCPWRRIPLSLCEVHPKSSTDFSSFLPLLSLPLCCENDSLFLRRPNGAEWHLCLPCVHTQARLLWDWLTAFKIILTAVYLHFSLEEPVRFFFLVTNLNRWLRAFGLFSLFSPELPCCL